MLITKFSYLRDKRGGDSGVLGRSFTPPFLRPITQTEIHIFHIN